MFIHFAFGPLGKQGKVEEQTQKTIDCILKERRLKISKCKEFIPTFNPAESKTMPFNMFEKKNDRLEAKIDLEEANKLPNAPPITYLPVDVPMICFIKTSFKKLRNSPHQNEYGKFGISLADSFLKSKGIRPVRYYTEKSLYKDLFIRKWNLHRGKDLSQEERKIIKREIVSYRKPAALFPSFITSVTAIVSKFSDGIEVQYFTYDRYPTGYDFTLENEYRITFKEGVEYLNFSENDLHMLITPNSKSQSEVEEYLHKNWEIQPKVVVFPS